MSTNFKQALGITFNGSNKKKLSYKASKKQKTNKQPKTSITFYHSTLLYSSTEISLLCPNFFNPTYSFLKVSKMSTFYHIGRDHRITFDYGRTALYLIYNVYIYLVITSNQ